MSVEKGYEVIRFIEHGAKCRPAMDYVRGKVLMYRLQEERRISKKLLFEWFHTLCVQMEEFHRCGNAQCYRYLNPYSILVTKDEGVLLLDLSAESNGFVMKKMQMPAMRNHFVKPVVQKRENTKVGIDLYGMGKTMQFTLSYVEIYPELSLKEEIILGRIIGRCLGEKGKKQYENFRQLKKNLPEIKKL